MPGFSNLESVSSYFRNSWQIYQEVLRHNYMEHREIYEGVSQYITEHYPRPFSLLELGCGDASRSSETLHGTPIKAYTGVDLAPTGLELAAENLSSLNCPIELIQGEMREFLENSTSTYDLILISFALHHLTAVDKQKLLGQCWQHLASGGTMLLIDVFRHPRETRAQYLTRCGDYIRTQWQELSLADIDSIIGHIENSDFPESEEAVRVWAGEIGFDRVESLYSGIQGIHKALALSK
jgi:SAM-dependent methyltransferase